ncbi:HAD-like domain-containing protein [Delphinella strobiligena]|nr:HAD-like domain-containing protein [Delphinella strobiligena]
MTSEDSDVSMTSQAFKPKGIIFDLLTGLLDFWSTWDSAIPAGSTCDGREWRERYLEITFKQGIYTPYHALVCQSAADVGLPPSASENLLNDWDNLRPWPEVPEVLVKLAARNIKLAVVTNCSAVLGKQAVHNLCNEVQMQCGEAFTFDIVVTAEESGWYKPRKEAYEAGLRALGLEAEEVLFVAGSAGDVEGASQAGMKVVWNNHVGLGRKGQIKPWVEAESLDMALDGLI